MESAQHSHQYAPPPQQQQQQIYQAPTATGWQQQPHEQPLAQAQTRMAGSPSSREKRFQRASERTKMERPFVTSMLADNHLPINPVQNPPTHPIQQYAAVAEPPLPPGAAAAAPPPQPQQQQQMLPTTTAFQPSAQQQQHPQPITTQQPPMAVNSTLKKQFSLKENAVLRLFANPSDPDYFLHRPVNAPLTAKEVFTNAWMIGFLAFLATAILLVSIAPPFIYYPTESPKEQRKIDPRVVVGLSAMVGMIVPVVSLLVNGVKMSQQPSGPKK